ncbi:MAG: thioredoxin reductase [Solirubrobacteraceae bacterium]|jgi:thioredoxin reductase (NADPH)|nr:thioredoxin reductase [Solirubrobacteraceae bacterium]
MADGDLRTAERRPAIVAVDDEPAVLAAVARDLRRGFGERYRILRAGSGAEALEILREVLRRGDQIALLVADQRMPGMAGTDYLVEARKIVPDAKRVLLTAYADTEAAIVAINEVALDYYLLKPWDPPEEHLFPVLEDLLTTWESGAALEAGGVRIIGHRFSKDSHDLRDFLARNRVPARWLDVERDSDARVLLDVAGIAPDRLPVALLEDGTVLERPTVFELAERLGVTGTPAQDHYDLVIVGGGPAGLAGAVYGASEGLRTVLVEREAPGGQAGQSSRIENYLGFPAGLSGSDLARRATDQARRLGAELLTIQDAVGLRAEGAGRIVELSDGGTLSSNCVLIASGVSYRQLDTPGFPELTGAGIYYGAALTEARSCADQEVVIIGGANSAGQAAVYFAGYARHVTILVRGPSLTKSMSHYLIAQLDALPNVEVRTQSVAVSAEGRDGHLRGLRVRDSAGDESTIDASACFVFIGAIPRTDWLDGVLARDERGFILAGGDAQDAGWPLARDPRLLETSIPGVFVAGDVRARSIKRVASAVGEGSMAVSLIHEYLADG